MKNSISKKLNIFKTSPLISAVALLEVIILICVSTFAWFVFADNNTLGTDVLSVEPDSGLEIDFKDASEKDFINIKNYINEFQFEPVTSLDGRNIFVPTSGTFNSTATSKIKFREATVNDMNSKYINIDFTLTNTGETDMPVYLSSRSFFKLYDRETEEEINSRAIRMAFYQNDGASGKISSSLLSQEFDAELPTEEPTEEPTEKPTEGGSVGGTYTVYLKAPSDWVDTDQVRAYVWGSTNSNGSFPGHVMTYDSSTGLYSYTYSVTCNKVIFSYHGDQNQTVDLDVYDQGVYTLEDGRNGTWALENIEIAGGTKVDGSGSNTGTEPSTGASTETPTQTTTVPTLPDEEEKVTVYFYNTIGWDPPYIHIWKENGDSDVPLSDWPGKPMRPVSGDVYYYTFNSKFDSVIFNDGNKSNGVQSADVTPVKNGHIYMINSTTGDNKFGWVDEDFNSSFEGGTYPVICPGVSTGFQRSYAPVTHIDDNSGSSKVVVPAFASSIDDYNNGSGNPLFTVERGQTISLSMIIWLEGTDPECSEDIYAGKFIDMNLVFATPDSPGEDMYTYQFLDKTLENWIADKVTTEEGLKFDPVIQLYDVDNHKGYMMSVHNDENGKKAVWQCRAPQSLADSGHIMFRRVNPLNEDEVWNYWDTNGFGGVTGAIKNETVYFTAFSDGAPTNVKNSSAPSMSCGGLWGNHNVNTVTLFDGTDGQWLKGQPTDKLKSVMTVNYTYNNQKIEYKASGDEGKGVYRFVLPDVVYTAAERPSLTFKRYYNWDDKHAMNSDKNQLTFHKSWVASRCQGPFFSICTDISDPSKTWTYWGSDMLYIQASNATTSKIDSRFLQVQFYSKSGGSDDEQNDFIVYPYKNSAYASPNDGDGYACVIPSNRKYFNYRVECCDSNNHNIKTDFTPLQAITYSNDKGFAHSNTVDKNICKINNFQITVFLQLSTQFCWQGNDPQCYAWYDPNGGNNGTDKNDAFGTSPKMTWDTDLTIDSKNYKQYKYVLDISQFNSVIFHNQDANNYKTKDIHGFGAINMDRNGIIFRSTSEQHDWAGQLYKSNNVIDIMGGYIPEETMNVSGYAAPNDWPQAI